MLYPDLTHICRNYYTYNCSEVGVLLLPVTTAELQLQLQPSSNQAHPARYQCVYVRACVHVCLLHVFVSVCAAISISVDPCVWSGTEPVIRYELTKSFSTSCFINVSLLSLSPSLYVCPASLTHSNLRLPFSDTESAQMSVCLAGSLSVIHSFCLSFSLFSLSSCL